MTHRQRRAAGGAAGRAAAYAGGVLRRRWEAVSAPAQPGTAPAHILRTAVVTAVISGIRASGMLVWGSSSALFSGTTANPTSSWTAGTVSLSDDDSATAMFSVASIQPGDSGSKCITVTYTGNVNANVRLYATLGGTGLGTYLDTTVEQGTGGSFASCTGFSSETSTTGTLAAFAAARTNYATGFGTWAPTANGQTRTYKIAWSVQSDNGAANKTATLALTWEAQG
ncbi:MAG TPA: hypothetical protein VFO77_13355 [Actinoplanes sp.]|nr:hypothetical protein [Actinoplanes sp.]